jgi:hypothetical protein
LGLDGPVFFDIKNPETNIEETEYHGRLAIVGAIGYDIYQRKMFVIDLKVRVIY